MDMMMDRLQSVEADCDELRKRCKRHKTENVRLRARCDALEEKVLPRLAPGFENDETAVLFSIEVWCSPDITSQQLLDLLVPHFDGTIELVSR